MLTLLKQSLGRYLVASVLMAAAMLVSGRTLAQTGQFDVRGVVADSNGTQLERAMVVALTRPDSVLAKFATTEGNGAFTLRRLPEGDYILQVTHIGYLPYRRDFSVTTADVDAGTVVMSILAHEMEAVVVSAAHVPFVNRNDTLDYNVAAFPTRPNATVEELLKRLPGIEVEEDGSITAQGEEVENVLVDGREFFGSDPTIATRNLPADAVDRVQVYDKESDMAEFTGIRDGEEERTINLQLREEARNGYFGRIAGALGADGGTYGVFDTPGDDQALYDQRFSINRFSPKTQLAVLGNINNVNQAGFSWGDYESFVGGAMGLTQMGGRGGGMQMGGGRNDGFTKSLAIGLNASHNFEEGRWIRTSYFLSRLDNRQDREIQRQELLGSEVSAFADQSSNQDTDNLTHRVNLNAQYRFAEGHDLRLRGDINLGTSSLLSLGRQTTRNLDGDTLNTAVTNYSVDGDDIGGTTNLTWRKRLSDNGRSIVLELRANLQDPDQYSYLTSTTGIRDRGDILTYEELIQEQSNYGRTFSHTQRLSLTQPFGTGRTLELYGRRRAVSEDKTRSVYDINGANSVLNEQLSSEFERTYSYLQGGLRLNRSSEDSWFVVGLEVQSSELEGIIVDRDERVATGFTHVLPSLNYRHQFTTGRTFNIRYTTSTREPSITELQPFTDNSNPLRIQVGNPNLTPEYRHNLMADYRFYDQFSFVNLSTSLRATYTTNDIVRSRLVDDNGRQQITSVNSGQGWSINGRMNYGRPIRWAGARVNLDYSPTYSTETEFINDAENVSHILRHTVGMGIENRDKERYDVETGGRITFNHVDYSLNEELNQSYANTTLYARGNYYLRGVWTFTTSVNYRIFDQDVFGPGNNVAMLEASVSRLLFDERAEIQLVAFDLLNQNQGVSFSSTSSAISETRTESLGHYLLLRFTYNMRAGAGGPREGMRGRGGRR